MKKKEILNALTESRADLMEALDDLEDEQLLEPGVNDAWSVKDILFHLTMWESELVKLLWQASQGQTPSTIHFSNLSVDEANAAWTSAAQDRSLEQVWDDFLAVRKQTIRRVKDFREDDFENPARFTWLSGQPLWKWIADDTFNHEAEHLEQIRRWRSEKEV